MDLFVQAGDIRQKPKIRRKCTRDIPLYCSSGGNVLECLKTLALQRTSQISSECRQALMDVRTCSDTFLLVGHCLGGGGDTAF